MCEYVEMCECGGLGGHCRAFLYEYLRCINVNRIHFQNRIHVLNAFTLSNKHNQFKITHFVYQPVFGRCFGRITLAHISGIQINKQLHQKSTKKEKNRPLYTQLK